MARGAGPIVGWTLGLMLAGSPVAADGPSILVVHLENAAGTPAADVDAVKSEVERVFLGAGISVQWAPALYRPVGELPCDGQRHVAVSLVNIQAPFYADARAGSEDKVAGRAAVEMQRAWVFPNRIQEVGQGRPVDVTLAVARAMVHEIGHLLLPARGHTRAGIMRAGLALDQDVPFRFTDAESSSMRSGLSGPSACRGHK